MLAFSSFVSIKMELKCHSNMIWDFYRKAIPGVPKFKDEQNPATWMLEASSTAIEAKLGIDFAEQYVSSNLCE